MLELAMLCSTLRSTIESLLKNCKNMRELKQIHAQIITSNLPPIQSEFLVSRLLYVCALSDFGSLRYANDVFKLVNSPSVSLYNILIRAHASQPVDSSHSAFPRSLLLYKQMLSVGVLPDCLTFPFLVKDCASKLDGGSGRAVHGQVVKTGFCSDLFVQNSLVSFYSACGFLSSAHKVFDEMTERDVVSYNAMIMGFLRSGDLEAALELFKRMEHRNVITWNSMITGFVQGGRAKQALELFREMQSSNVFNDEVKPDKVTVAGVLAACSSLGTLDYGKWVHSYLKRTGLESDMVIETALIDMFGKCGCIKRAYSVFKDMKVRDTSAWTAMISACAINGYGEEAIKKFEQMEEERVRPNDITFAALLSACAHSGLVEKGRWLLDRMCQVYLIKPKVHHYTRMIDILSRAALFKEAEELITSMPMEPDVFVWGALLGGCQMHGNAELGSRVAQHLIYLDPINYAFYMNLCDVYAKAGKFEEVNRTRALMKERGIKKKIPGCSLIEVDGVVLEFTVKGSSDIATQDLILVLDRLSYEMKLGSCTSLQSFAYFW